MGMDMLVMSDELQKRLRDLLIWTHLNLSGESEDTYEFITSFMRKFRVLILGFIDA